MVLWLVLVMYASYMEVFQPPEKADDLKAGPNQKDF